MDDNRLKFLIETYKDCRGEIEKRISQRDTFSIQFVLAIGTIISVGMLNFPQSPYLFFLLPFVTLFYSIQIIYSYAIHERIHAYLCTELEPEIARILQYSPEEMTRFFWETYSDRASKRNRIKTPGIRKNFFLTVSFLSPFLAATLFVLVGIYKNLYDGQLYIYFVVAAVFVVVSVLIIFFSLRRSIKKSKNRL